MDSFFHTVVRVGARDHTVLDKLLCEYRHAMYTILFMLIQTDTLQMT